MKYVDLFEQQGKFGVECSKEEAELVAMASLERWETEQRAGRKLGGVCEVLVTEVSGEVQTIIEGDAGYIGQVSDLLKWYGERTGDAALEGWNETLEPVLQPLRQDRYVRGSGALALGHQIAEICEQFSGAEKDIAFMYTTADDFVAGLISEQET